MDFKELMQDVGRANRAQAKARVVKTRVLVPPPVSFAKEREGRSGVEYTRYVPGPGPVLRPGALDYKLCPSHGMTRPVGVLETQPGKWTAVGSLREGV